MRVGVIMGGTESTMRGTGRIMRGKGMREEGIGTTMTKTGIGITMNTRERITMTGIDHLTMTKTEKISVMAETLVVRITPASDAELVKVIVMKTWTVNEAWCVEEIIVAPGVLGLTPQMIAAGIPVMERIVVVAETMLVKRVKAIVIATLIVRMI